MPGEPTVYVIDDDQAVRDSLQFLLESAGRRVRTFQDATAFLETCDANPHCTPSCLVLDLGLPGLSGLDLLDELRRRKLTFPVIVITGHGDMAAAIRAMKAGALDFIEKPFNDEHLLTLVREAIEQDKRYRVHRATQEAILERVRLLTARERQVMNMVVLGKLNKQIATELGLSHKTVEVHRAHVMDKMGVKSLAELVRLAVVLEQPTLPST